MSIQHLIEKNNENFWAKIKTERPVLFDDLKQTPQRAMFIGERITSLQLRLLEEVKKMCEEMKDNSVQYRPEIPNHESYRQALSDLISKLIELLENL